MANTVQAKSHILLVEDDDMLRNVLATALESEGHSVEMAANGGEAELLLSASTFNLVITDVLMPEKDGIEVIMDIRAGKKSTTPIIAMTGSHMYTDLYLKTAAALGARQVLAKPFSLSEFLDATREALSGMSSAA